MATQNPKIQLGIEANADQAVGEMNRVKGAAKGMAEDVKRSGREGADALNPMGEGAKVAADKIDRSTKAMIQSIQRTTVAMETGSRSSAEYYRLLSQQRGIGGEALEPYIRQLEAVQRKQAEANAALLGGTRGLNDMGMTAKQTTAALRQVPAQFTDIIVSLQGGQAPLTVLLQQGGQLKDVFGGVGAAAQALGGYILGLVNPFSVAAAAAATLGVAYYQGAKESQAFTATLITTGNQAGVTAGQLMGMAQAIDSVAGTQGNAAEVLAQLAATGQVTGSSLRTAAQAAIEFERAGGQAAAETVKQFAELGKAPLQATLKLNESMGYLTKSTYEQIKSLEEQGRTVEAARVAQDAFADALNGRTPELLKNLGLLERGWQGIKDKVTEAWDAIKGIGREVGVEGQASALNSAVQSLEEQIRRRGGTSSNVFNALTYGQTPYDRETEALRVQLATLKERQAILQSDERLLKSAAENQAQRAREVKANAEWEKEGLKYLDASTKMSRELVKIRNEGVAAGRAEAEIVKRQAEYLASQAKADPKAKVDRTAEREAAEARKRDLEVIATRNKLVEQTAKDAMKAQADAWKEADKAAAAYGKQLDDIELAGAALVTQANERTDAVNAQIAATEFELSLMGKSNTERAIAIKQYQIEVDLKKEIARINATIASQEDKAYAINAVTAAANKAKANAAAEVVNAEFQRVSQQIEQSLTDALMRGFESGKGFAENLRDTVANMFKTLVLRPVIQATVQGGLNAVGLGGTSGGGNLLGTASNAYSAYSSLGTMGSLSSSAGIASGMTYGTAAFSQQSVMLAAQEAGFSAAAGASAGAASGTIAAAAPYVAAVLAIAAIADATKGETRFGGQYGYNFGDGLTDYRRGGDFAGATLGVNRITGAGSLGAQNDAAVSSAINTTVLGINKRFEALGSGATLTAYQAGLETSGKGRGGVFAGGTLSTGAKFGEDGSGDLYAGTLFERTSTQSPDAQTAITNFGLDLQQSAIQALQSAPDIPQAIKKLVTGIDAESLTAESASALLQTIDAQIEGVNQLRSAFEAMGLEQFADMGFDAASGLAAAAGGFEALGDSLSSYYQDFYTEAERTANTTRQLTTRLAGFGIELPTTREAYRALVENALASGNNELAAELLRMNGAFASIVPSAGDAATAIADAAAEIARAAEDALKKAKTTALAQLDASAQRERAAWQLQAEAAASLRNEVQGIFDTLATNIRELRSEATGPVQTAAQGRAFIASALAGVQAGAGLPDGSALADAISASRGGLGMENFASVADQRFEQLRLAGELAVLQEAAGDQLSTAERQLLAAEEQIEQIDKTLVYWRQLLDGTQDGIDATMSVADAVNNLRDLMFPDAAGAKNPDGTPAKPGFGGFVIGGGGSGTSANAALSRLGNTYYGALGTVINDTAYIDRFDSINSFVNTLDFSAGNAAASAAALQAAAQEYGVSAREIAIATGYKLEDVQALLPDLPKYAAGTNYVPQTGLALLHKGEAVIPAAQGAPWRGDSSSADLLAEMRAMRQALDAAHAQNAALSTELLRHAERTANAANGQTERPMLVEIAA